MQMILDTEYGGMNEVLYNLAVITGEERFAPQETGLPRSASLTRLRCGAMNCAACIPIRIFPKSLARPGDMKSAATTLPRRGRLFLAEMVETRTYATGGHQQQRRLAGTA